MSVQPPPRVVLQGFNPDDYTYQNDIPLTLYQGNLLYVKKAGDTITGSIFFNNTNIFNNAQQFYGDINVITGNDTTAYIKTDGSVLCSSLNNISAVTLSYVDATSSIQTQFNSINTNIGNIEFITQDMSYNTTLGTTQFAHNIAISGALTFGGNINNKYGVQ